MREGKSDQATRCIKSRTMTKVIDYVLSIDAFEQKCVVLKCLLQAQRLKDHVHNIGTYPSLSKNDIYEHKCLKNIKRLYKQADKCNDQQKLEDILEAYMVFTPKGFLYLLGHHTQSKIQVLENNCVCLLTF